MDITVARGVLNRKTGFHAIDTKKGIFCMSFNDEDEHEKDFDDRIMECLVEILRKEGHKIEQFSVEWDKNSPTIFLFESTSDFKEWEELRERVVEETYYCTLV